MATHPQNPPQTSVLKPKPKAARNGSAYLSLGQVQEHWAALPEVWRNGAVGKVYADIIALLEPAGKAPLAAVLLALFPGWAVSEAKLSLGTQYANRPYRDAAGQVPLRLKLSRVQGGRVDAAEVWFESGDLLQPAQTLPDNPRYAPERFVSSTASQATGQELLEQAKKQALLPNPSAFEPTPVAGAQSRDLRQAMLDQDLGNHPSGRRNQGVVSSRTGVSPLDYIPQTHAEVRQGNAMALAARGLMEDQDELDAAPAGKSLGHLPKTTVALDAMLEWCTNPAPGAPRLLALLGDYGSGKTSHAMQFARVLNGEVEHPAWPPKLVEGESAHAAGAQAPPTATLPIALPTTSPTTSPTTIPSSALFIDLADLAGISNLANLPLPELLFMALRKRQGDAMHTIRTEQDVLPYLAQARAGAMVMVFDGLDELLKNDRQVLHNVFGQLLRVLERPVGQRGKPGLARVVVSCRSHYFRDVEQEHAFFDTRQRGVASSNDYLCLTLKPWEADNIQAYLQKRLQPADAERLQAIIDTTYNLAELASRPVLLAMMSEQIEALLRQAHNGQPISAAGLYSITVAEWIARDDGKHQLAPEHKPLLMGALATAMWNQGDEIWPADQLDPWVLRQVNSLFPQRYSVAQAAALQDDLRTATFIVRSDAKRFNFAHRSFMEYFLARFVLDALDHCAHGNISEALLRANLPTHKLNAETLQFLQELWAADLLRLEPRTLSRRVNLILRQLQGDAALQNPAEANPTLPPAPLPPAPPLHAVLWQIVQTLNLAQEGAAWELDPNPGPIPNQALNLRGLDFMEQLWQQQDFASLPPLDLRGANLRGLHARHCRFGQVLCNAHTNWSQAVLRGCDTHGIAWGASERGGLLVRAKGLPDVKALGGLLGPWALPIASAGVTSVAFSPDGQTVLTGSYDYTARLWRVSDGLQLRSLQGHTHAVMSVAFSPDGQTVLTGSMDTTARLWRVSDGQELRCLRRHKGTVTSVAFSPDGQTVLTGSVDTTARLWRVSDGQQLRSLQGYEYTVTSVAFSPDGQTALTGSHDRTALLWRVSDGQKLRSFQGHESWVLSVAFSPDGQSVLAGSMDGTVRLWRVSDEQEPRCLQRHKASVGSVAFSPDGQTVLTGSMDDTARLWRVNDGQELRRLDGHQSLVMCAAFSPDGQSVLTGSMDGTVRLWRLDTGQESRVFQGHGFWVECVAFSPDGELVLTGGDDRSARLWHRATGQPIRSFPGHELGWWSVAFSPDGNEVITVTHTKTAQVWDAKTGEKLRVIQDYNPLVERTVFSPDGKYKAVAGQGGYVETHSLERNTYRVHVPHPTPPFEPSWAEFDADGKLLDCSESAAEHWLFYLGGAGGMPQPLEFAFN